MLMSVFVGVIGGLKSAIDKTREGIVANAQEAASSYRDAGELFASARAAHPGTYSVGAMRKETWEALPPEIRADLEAGAAARQRSVELREAALNRLIN